MAEIMFPHSSGAAPAVKKLSDNPNNRPPKIHGSRAERPLSFSVTDFPVPSGKEEEWRFTPLERISDFFTEQAAGAEPTVTASGIELESVPMSDKRLGKVSAPEDRVGALAWQGAQRAYIAQIPAGSIVSDVATISIRGESAAAASDLGVSAAELLIDAGAHSEATIILDHGGAARLAEGVEVRIGEGANVTLVSIQDWSDDSAHALSFRMNVGRDASFKHIVVSLGGDLVRVTTSADFAGPGAETELMGAYFAHSGQHLEHRLFVDHNQPKCRSNAVYKGALQGENAHSVWVGDVLIRPEAEGINTYELNRNLLLTKGAKADSVPNLEIKTGRIEGAGHASATGRFDDEQLFYLRSRGIPEKEARRLVVMGFFAELINQIGVQAVQEKLLAHIEKELIA